MKKIMMMFFVFMILGVNSPMCVEASEVDNTMVVTSVVDSSDFDGSSETLPAVGYGAISGGVSFVVAFLIHKRQTKTFISKGETLVWNKQSVKVIDTQYVKTYETVDKDFYKKKD